MGMKKFSSRGGRPEGGWRGEGVVSTFIQLGQGSHTHTHQIDTRVNATGPQTQFVIYFGGVIPLEAPLAGYYVAGKSNAPPEVFPGNGGEIRFVNWELHLAGGFGGRGDSGVWVGGG